jgi:hypothetical protein
LLIKIVIDFLSNYKNSKNKGKIQNDPLSLQLFDRRAKVYDSIQGCLFIPISSTATDKINTLPQSFLQKTCDVPFLFGKDIENKRDEIYDTFLELRLVYQKLKSVFISNEEKQRLFYKENKLLKKILNYSRDLQRIFQPYIDLSRYQVTPEISSKNNDMIKK